MNLPNKEHKNPFVKWGFVDKNKKSKTFGKPKISASLINLWSENPASVIAKYVLGCTQETTQVQKRGLVAEQNVFKLLSKEKTFDDIDQSISDDFKNETLFIGEEEEKTKHIKELIGYKTYNATKKDGTKTIKKNYKGFVRNAYDIIKNYGQPSSYQKLVWYELPYFEVNVHGYKDFTYNSDNSDKNFSIDLKTSNKLSQTLSKNFCRQMTMYNMENGEEQKLVMATKEKASLFIIEDYKESKEEILHIINTICIALTECNSISELLERYYPNWDFWKMSIDEKERLKKELSLAHKRNWQKIVLHNEFVRGLS